jgi:hypothetical protein
LREREREREREKGRKEERKKGIDQKSGGAERQKETRLAVGTSVIGKRSNRGKILPVRFGWNSANESKKIDGSAFSLRILLFFRREKKGLITRGKLSSQEKKKKKEEKTLIEVKIGQKRPFSANFRLFSSHAGCNEAIKAGIEQPFSCYKRV